MRAKKERIAGKMKAGVLSAPSKNNFMRILVIVILMIATALLIMWVSNMSRKAEETIAVVMLNQNVYKNQVINENMLHRYDMLKGEYEKFAIENSGGTKKHRILLWEERGQILNWFAAYPLQQDTYAFYRDFIKTRVDNSDNALYAFPGKEIVPLEIPNTELQAFKTFLQPGDRINIVALFTQSETIVEDDGYGSEIRTKVETARSENVFNSILVADLINSKGESILDIYAGYREKTVYEQARLDTDQTFRDSVEPKTLLVALTPEEKDRYYYYLSKTSVQFKASLPQRIE